MFDRGLADWIAVEIGCAMAFFGGIALAIGAVIGCFVTWLIMR